MCSDNEQYEMVLLHSLHRNKPLLLYEFERGRVSTNDDDDESESSPSIFAENGENNSFQEFDCDVIWLRNNS